MTSGSSSASEEEHERLFRHALTLHGKGALEDAVKAYRHLAGLIPDAAPVFVNLGIALKTLRRLDEAEESLGRAVLLAPRLAEAHSNLGCVLMEQGRLKEAEAALSRAVALKPNDPEPINNLGAVFDAAGRLEEARAAFQCAIDLDSQRPQSYCNLGAVLVKLKRSAEAITACRNALALHPRYAEAWNNLGNALSDSGHADEAMDAYQKALALRPGYAEAGTNLAAVLHDLARFKEAASQLGRVISANPDYAFAYNNLGNTLLAMNRLEEAEAAFRKALTLTPDDSEIHFNFSAVLLKRGQFTEGWREYDWRRRKSGSPLACVSLPRPEWDGSPLAGRTLLLYAEQGLGDTLQFCRFAPIAARMGGRVILQVQAPLTRLLRSLSETVEVIGFGAPLPAFDCHLPLMSVPGVLGIDLDSIPAAIPYLWPDPAAAARWSARLSGLHGLKVGLSWAGAPRPGNKLAHLLDMRRSLALECFAPLASLSGISFVSLQKGTPAAQAATPPPGMALTDWMEETADMADTAALVSGLDLVITVDTSIAHLAGALGRRVWILSRFDGCWRWLEDREDSPWYPTARLFRQRAQGVWDPVVEAIRKDLQDLMASS